MEEAESRPAPTKNKGFAVYLPPLLGCEISYVAQSLCIHLLELNKTPRKCETKDKILACSIDT